jgi:hypothetical protein
MIEHFWSSHELVRARSCLGTALSRLRKGFRLNTDDTCSIDIPLPQITVTVAAATAGPTAFTSQVDETATQQWKFFGGQTYDIDGHPADRDVLARRDEYAGRGRQDGPAMVRGLHLMGDENQRRGRPVSLFDATFRVHLPGDPLAICCKTTRTPVSGAGG